MKTIIYYFSGTGNSLVIARDLALELGKAEVKPLAKAINQEKILPDAERIGLVYPVYAGGPPLIVSEFAKKLELNKNQYLFLVTNYGGMQGAAASRLVRLLRRRQINPKSVFGITMPDNYTPLYESPSGQKQEAIFKKEKAKIKKIVQTLNSTKPEKIEMSFFLARWLLWEPIYGIFSLKLPEKDKKFWLTEKCNGCGICEKVCPVANIKMENQKPSWQHKCQQCFACFHWCPQEAVQSGKKTIKRKRYRHPEVNLESMIEAACSI